jgi:3-deoxy-D-manno-octulosonate 8-phosphate phosphatase (KDO 8-P phosphatase)
MYKELSPELQQKLAGIRLVFTDVDGVHTDDTFRLGVASNGERVEVYQFHTGDGIAIKECLRNNIPVIFITGRKSPAVIQRATDLGTRFLTGVSDKVAAVEDVMAELGVPWEHILFIGNDIQDISLLKRAGISVAPANSADEAKAVAHHVAQKRGGEGVVREVLQAVLEAKGLWEKIVAGDKTLG